LFFFFADRFPHSRTWRYGVQYTVSSVYYFNLCYNNNYLLGVFLFVDRPSVDHCYHCVFAVRSLWKPRTFQIMKIRYLSPQQQCSVPMENQKNKIEMKLLRRVKPISRTFTIA
jgi:hypothetical protein